jgi:hypothetical protein
MQMSHSTHRKIKIQIGRFLIQKVNVGGCSCSTTVEDSEGKGGPRRGQPPIRKEI